VLVILSLQAMTNPTATAKAIGRLAAGTRNPMPAARPGGQAMQESFPILTGSGNAACKILEAAIRAFMTLVDCQRYPRNRRSQRKISVNNCEWW